MTILPVGSETEPIQAIPHNNELNFNDAIDVPKASLLLARFWISSTPSSIATKSTLAWRKTSLVKRT